jgi:hypothetical protein
VLGETARAGDLTREIEASLAEIAARGARLSGAGPIAPKDVSNHAFCVILGAILALAVAVMGYVLLP